MPTARIINPCNITTFLKQDLGCMRRVWEGDKALLRRAASQRLPTEAGPPCPYEQRLDSRPSKTGRLQPPGVDLPSPSSWEQAGSCKATSPATREGSGNGKEKLPFTSEVNGSGWGMLLGFRSPPKWIRCTWTLVPEDAPFPALLHPGLSRLSPQASRLHSISCRYLRWSWQSTQSANRRLLGCLRT